MATTMLDLQLSGLKADGAQELWNFIHADSETMPKKLQTLKTLAEAFKMDKSWQSISKSGLWSRQLGDILKQTRKEFWMFRQEVLRTSDAAAKLLKREAQASCREDSQDGAAVTRKRKRKEDPKGESLESVPSSLTRWQAAMRTCVHLVPSGSGTVVRVGGQPRILTCAHCVEADGDDEEEDPNRLGRLALVVWHSGMYALAECERFDNEKDYALLKILAFNPSAKSGAEGLPIRLEASSIATCCPPKGTNCMCIHNPYDWDLELPEGAQPRKSGYIPFTSSAGKIQGFRSNTTKDSDLGGTKHSCWTYWGTSGAALFNGDGHIVAMHNSWNPRNAQRHAVSWEWLRECCPVE